MKKLILMATFILAISTAAFAGCSNTDKSDGSSVPENSYNLVESVKEDAEISPSVDEQTKPQPRVPRCEKRTDENNDGDCQDGNCDEDKKECPHFRKPRRHHREHDGHPIPRPEPVQPKN